MHVRTSDQGVLDLGFGGYSCNWGTHIAGFYETADERDQVILGFLHQGDLAGDLQICCPAERTLGDFRSLCAYRYPERAGRTHDPDVFRLSPPRELYCAAGGFSPAAMVDALERCYAENGAQARRFIRATAEMSWAREAIPGIEGLMAYEAQLNRFSAGRPWVSICLFNLRVFSGQISMHALRTHPFTISGGVIIENPYYQEPKLWLAKNAPRYAPGMLAPHGVAR